MEFYFVTFANIFVGVISYFIGKEVNSNILGLCVLFVYFLGVIVGTCYKGEK